ncbi:MAG: molecular chaperone DnaJ [Candidatus Hydrogenedentes bacterium]|nr:molecular chaperone DnaJ [Candidatus Hydrogenedentota bacterium]
MPKSTDLYEILGVDRSATQEQIRKAYLKLAHKYHPDKTGGDKEAEEKLKQINAAYDVLKSPDKRAQYDRFGSADGQGFSGFGGQGFGGGGGGGFEAPFEDFFDMLFGQGGKRGPGGSQAGNDLELRLSITLEDAAFGTKKKIRYNRREACGDCKGSGAAPGSRPETCPHCHGAGQVRVAHGFFSVTRTCPHCQGAGKTISKPCGACNGKGQTKGTRELSVDVPAGVDSGSRLRVTGEGEAGHGGGRRGDLYIFIEVQKHPFFERDGATIHCEIPVTFSQAALGASVRVPTLEGEAELKIPAGAQTGAQLRLRGLGMPDLRGYRQGDQIVRIVVETPQKLSKKQRDLLREFDEQSDSRTYPLCDKFTHDAEKSQRQ